MLASAHPLRLLISAAALASATALAAPAPSSQPAGVPAFSAADDLALGAALLRDGDYANARDVFESAMKVEPNNPRAMHGLALSHYALDQKDKAVIFLERAIRTAPGDRAIVNNLAAVRIATGEPMRGVKALSDYLASIAKSTAIDEPMVDALGTALAGCDDKSKKARQWALSDAVLQQAVTRLELARPGYRKFGARWLSADQFAGFEADNQSQRDEIERLGRRVSDVQRNLESSQRRREEILRKMRTGFATQFDLDAIDQQIEHQQGRIQSLRDEAVRCEKRIHRPVWAEGLAILTIDATVPPDFASEPPLDHAQEPGRDSPDIPIDPVGPAKNGVLIPPPNSNAPVDAAPKLVVRHAAAFAVGVDRVVTSALAVHDASSVKVHLPDGSDRQAQVVKVDRDLGLAILQIPDTQLSPLQIAEESIEGKSTVVSYPSLSLFEPRASSLPATITQLDGELSVAMDKSPGLSGGPVLVDGAVAGVVMTDRYDVTPPVRLITAEVLRAFLEQDLAKDAAPLAGDPAAKVFLVTAEHGGAAPGDESNDATPPAPTTRPNRPRRDRRGQ